MYSALAESSSSGIPYAPELLKGLIDFCKTFESTIGYQRYDHNVFVELNDRYIKSKKQSIKRLENENSIIKTRQ